MCVFDPTVWATQNVFVGQSSPNGCWFVNLVPVSAKTCSGQMVLTSASLPLGNHGSPLLGFTSSFYHQSDWFWLQMMTGLGLDMWAKLAQTETFLGFLLEPLLDQLLLLYSDHKP